MTEKQTTKKKAPSAYDFCPKHHVFYASCGCAWEKKGKSESESEEIFPVDPLPFGDKEDENA